METHINHLRRFTGVLISDVGVILLNNLPNFGIFKLSFCSDWIVTNYKLSSLFPQVKCEGIYWKLKISWVCFWEEVYKDSPKWKS